MTVYDEEAIDEKEHVPLIEKKLQEEQIKNEEEASRLRGQSKHKWYVLMCLVFIWSSCFHCIFSCAALENDLINEYDLSYAEFGLFTTLTFLFAAVSALSSPFLVYKYGIYIVVMMAQCFITLGQLVVYIGIINKSLILIYFGRCSIGIGFGVDYVCIMSLVGIWFKTSKWSSFAFTLNQNGITIGILSSRYVLVPIYNSYHHLSYPFLLGVILCLLSIFAIIYLMYNEYLFVESVNNGASNADNGVGGVAVSGDVGNSSIGDDDNENTDIANNNIISEQVITELNNGIKTALDKDFSKIKQIDFLSWCLILILVLGTSSIQVYENEMEKPLQDKFNMSEYLSDLCLATQNIVALTMGPVVGFIISYFRIKHIGLIVSNLLLNIGVLLLIFAIDLIYTPWIANIIYAVAMEMFFTCALSCIYTVLPNHLISITTSIFSCLILSTSTIGCYIFDYLQDLTGNWNYSFYYLTIFTIISFVLSLFVNWSDQCMQRILSK